MTSSPAVPFDRSFDGKVGRLDRVSPMVRRIVAPNPGPMTFTGTCTYVVGHGTVTVIDPGPELPDHVAALLDGLGGERVAQIVVTHTHRDHSPAARLLRAATGASIVGCAPHTFARKPSDAERDGIARSVDIDHAPDRVLTEGEVIEGDGFTLEAVATPGHTMNHLAFSMRQENALFSGDHVMAWSTTVVTPPSGSMRAYRASLERLRMRGETVYWPGHGGPVRNPKRFVRALLHHRRQRDAGIAERLQAGDETATAIAGAIYEGLSPALRQAAAMSVLARLEELAEDGVARLDGGHGLEARYRLSDAGG